MNIIDCDDINAKQCLDDFIERISDEVTISCSLPMGVPAKNIANIVDAAKKYFYRVYEDAVEPALIALSWKHQVKPEFRKGLNNMRDILTKEQTLSPRGLVMMPDNVYSVNAVYEIGKKSGEAGWGAMNRRTGDPDFGLDRYLFTNMYNGNIAISADNLRYYTCTEYFLDMSRQLLQEPITYNYNRLTHKLKFMGELPTHTVVFEVLTKIDDC